MLLLLALLLLLSFHGIFVAGGNPAKAKLLSGPSDPKLHAETANEIIAKYGKFTIRMAKKEDVNDSLRKLYKLLSDHLDSVTENKEKDNGKVEKKEENDTIKLTNQQIGEHLESKIMECFVVNDEDLPKNEFVAYAIYYFAASSEEGKIMHLEDFFIKEGYRGKGTKLADLIFFELAKMASKHSVNSIEWTVPEKNAGAISFYNRQNAVNLSKPEIGMDYWRFPIQKSNELLGKMVKEIHVKNGLHVSITSIGKSCKTDGMAKQEVKAEELAKQWENLFGKSKTSHEKHDGANGHLYKHKRHEADEGHLDKNLAKLLNVNDEGNEKEHRSLGSVTVKKGGQIVGMALFHCNAYSSWTGPYIWLDDLKLVKSEHLNEAGTLIFEELAKIGSELEAERIEWMAPALENIGIGTSNGAINEPPHPNSFPGHIAFYKEIGAINLTDENNGGWVLYRWPKAGFEEKIKIQRAEEEMKQEGKREGD